MSYYGNSDISRPGRPATVAESNVRTRKEGDETPAYMFSPTYKPGPKYETVVQPMPPQAEYHRANAYQDAALNAVKRQLNFAGGVNGPSEVYNPHKWSKTDDKPQRSRSLSPTSMSQAGTSLGYAASNFGGTTAYAPSMINGTNVSGSVKMPAPIASPPGRIANPFSPAPQASVAGSAAGMTPMLQTTLPGGFAMSPPTSGMAMPMPMMSPALSATGGNPYFQQAGTIGPMSSVSQQPPMFAPSVMAPGSAYPAQQPMSVAGGSASGGDGRPVAANARYGAGSRQNFQRFEQWTDHPYLHGEPQAHRYGASLYN